MHRLCIDIIVFKFQKVNKGILNNSYKLSGQSVLKRHDCPIWYRLHYVFVHTWTLINTHTVDRAHQIWLIGRSNMHAWRAVSQLHYFFMSLCTFWSFKTLNYKPFTGWKNTEYYKISSFLSQRKTTVLRIWNNESVSKWWVNYRWTYSLVFY